MIGFIIFGTTELTFTKSRGEFFCPACGAKRDYQEKSIRNFFTLYFIPLIPLNQVGHVIMCGTCQGTFTNEVLTMDEESMRNAHQRQFAEHCRRLMILMMLADGVASEEEIAVVNHQTDRLGGEPYSADEMWNAISLARQAEISVAEYAREIGPTLSTVEMENVIRCLFLVAAASGELGQAQQSMLQHLPQSLGVSDEEFRRVVATAANE